MPRLLPLAGLCLAAGPAAAQTPAPAPAAAKPAPTVAATVNGEAVPLAAVDAEVKRLQAATGPLTAKQVRQLRGDVLADLVDDTLLRQYLRQHGPQIDPGEVDKLFAGLAASLDRQGKTPAQYFKETGRTEAEIRAQWTVMLRFTKFADALATEAELKKYLAAHVDQFDGSAVRVSQIVVRLPVDAPPGERAAAHNKLTTLRAEITAGAATFAAAAKKHSVDVSAAAGGDLGFIARRDAFADPAVTAAAYKLAVGEVSVPVDSPAGVHLVTVTGRKPGAAPAFEAVADWVRESYLEDVRTALVGKLRAGAAVVVTLPD